MHWKEHYTFSTLAKNYQRGLNLHFKERPVHIKVKHKVIVLISHSTDQQLK